MDKLAEWAEELALHLGRPADVILSDGLYASDFSVGSSVELHFPDGSEARFLHAFHIVSPAKTKVCVFTEHCGYITFDLQPDLAITRHQKTVYMHE